MSSDEHANPLLGHQSLARYIPHDLVCIDEASSLLTLLPVLYIVRCMQSVYLPWTTFGRS